MEFLHLLEQVLCVSTAAVGYLGVLQPVLLPFSMRTGCTGCFVWNCACVNGESLAVLVSVVGTRGVQNGPVLELVQILLKATTRDHQLGFHGEH